MLGSGLSPQERFLLGVHLASAQLHVSKGDASGLVPSYSEV